MGPGLQVRVSRGSVVKQGTKALPTLFGSNEKLRCGAFQASYATRLLPHPRHEVAMLQTGILQTIEELLRERCHTIGTFGLLSQRFYPTGQLRGAGQVFFRNLKGIASHRHQNT